MFTHCLSLAFALILSAPAAAADEPRPPSGEEVKDAQARIAAYLKALPGGEAARVAVITASAEPFPDHILFSVLYPLYPVARIPPEPLQSANVFAVPRKKDGKPVPITDVPALEKFFKEHTRAATTNARVRAAVETWLFAAAALSQDGFYRFTVKPGNVVKDKDKEGVTVCAGEAPVDTRNGDRGEIMATLSFKDGKLASVETKVNLRPGMRPRCQATKLLDPDPIVRGMAEDAIRFMGRSAKPYLDEQRAKASPELRKAIDRMWRIIEEEDR